MSHGDASEGAAQFSANGARGTPDPSFSGDERPIVQRVFKKLCNLSDTLEEIEGWIDSQDASEARLLLPSSAKGHQIVITPENLDLFVAAERQAIVESREALGVSASWTV